MNCNSFYKFIGSASARLALKIFNLISMNKVEITTYSSFPHRSCSFKFNLGFISCKGSYIALAKNFTEFRATIFFAHLFINTPNYVEMDFTEIILFPFYGKSLYWILFFFFLFCKHLKKAVCKGHFFKLGIFFCHIVCMMLYFLLSYHKCFFLRKIIFYKS